MRLAGRSPRELAFRLQQQIANLAILALPPTRPSRAVGVDLHLPAVPAVPPDEILALAEEILAHRFPIFGTAISTGPDIEWRRDYINDKVSALSYFRFVPYLDFEKVGDHKNIWELNRHQHLVVLAQAHQLQDNPAYLKETEAELQSWWIQNPFLKGINWASALEVAFRSLSWLWIDHFVGSSLGTGVRRQLWDSLYQHAAYLEHNLSTYFSPNTHLLGEAIALHAIGLKLGVEKWRKMGAQIVDEQLDRQVGSDGSHFEQSTYYHVYALDFFLLHYQLAGRPKQYPPKLRAMARFLTAITGPAGLLTCFGDDDGGRLFHPYGPRDEFARATLASCAMLFPDDPVDATSVSSLFPDSGLVAINRGAIQILVDSGPMGWGGAGHSHADALSVTLRVSGREVLIDPGTFTYVADAKLRDDFRGTAFHNTVCIDKQSQADPAGPFRWNRKPSVRRLYWNDQHDLAFLDAECCYREFRHRRRVLMIADEILLIVDDVSSTQSGGEHSIDQYWHLGDLELPILFSDPSAVRREEGTRSRILGQKETAPVICASWRTTLPRRCATAILFQAGSPELQLVQEGLDFTIPGVIFVSFPAAGMPEVSRA